MPGNEIDVAKEIISNMGVKLNHLGSIESLAVYTGDRVKEIRTSLEVEKYLKSDDSHKKADFLINNKGISVKQDGGSKLQNKIQRKYLQRVFNHLSFTDEQINKTIENLDSHIKNYHHGETKRDVFWEEILNESEFKILLEHFTMFGSQVKLESSAPAEFILIDKKIPSINTMNIFTFNEFFDLHKKDITFSARPTWTNQGSFSESNRAFSLSKDPDNAPWVFNGNVCHLASGEPRSGWDKKAKIKKTCYYFDISIK